MTSTDGVALLQTAGELRLHPTFQAMQTVAPTFLVDIAAERHELLNF